MPAPPARAFGVRVSRLPVSRPRSRRSPLYPRARSLGRGPRRSEPRASTPFRGEGRRGHLRGGISRGGDARSPPVSRRRLRGSEALRGTIRGRRLRRCGLPRRGLVGRRPPARSTGPRRFSRAQTSRGPIGRGHAPPSAARRRGHVEYQASWRDGHVVADERRRARRSGLGRCPHPQGQPRGRRPHPMPARGRFDRGDAPRRRESGGSRLHGLRPHRFHVCGRGISQVPNLTGATARQTNFEGARLRGAHLVRTVAGPANLRGAEFEGADLSEANLEDACCEDATLRQVRAQNANLSKGRFAKASLEGGSFRGANLQFADFSHACLDGADFAGANLDGANLHRARCAATSFRGAKMKDVSATKLRSRGGRGLRTPRRLRSRARGFDHEPRMNMSRRQAECMASRAGIRTDRAEVNGVGRGLRSRVRREHRGARRGLGRSRRRALGLGRGGVPVSRPRPSSAGISDIDERRRPGARRARPS